ncbi:hypothetical protein LX36DRAFT_201634 [Colletotrichum falcatum]|nr:hypothetical protein LX36DRAFT_201634 [Colletotrichum falcatum]
MRGIRTPTPHRTFCLTLPSPPADLDLVSQPLSTPHSIATIGPNDLNISRMQAYKRLWFSCMIFWELVGLF